MPETVHVCVNGTLILVPPGTTVAAAIGIAGISAIRRSVTGEPRGPLCGMGVCFECRAVVDGVAHSRTCQTLCRTGMEVWTDAG